MNRVTRLGAVLTLLALLAALAVSPAVRGQDGDTVKRVGKRMMCLCGCNQILVECNHVGCSMSSEMIGKLKQRVSRNESDDLILQAFVQEYGQRVMAEPPAKGFNLTAWVMPLFALALGSAIVVVALIRMSRPAAGTTPSRPTVSSEEMQRLRMQADRESEE